MHTTCDRYAEAKQNPNYVPAYKTVGECVSATIKYSGVRGPFQGLGATLTRNLPAGAIYFGVFENTKNYFASKNESGVATDVQIMIAGGAGGFFYWSLFYPIDVIKSAIMTDSINPAERQYKVGRCVLLVIYRLTQSHDWHGSRKCLVRHP